MRAKINRDELDEKTRALYDLRLKTASEWYLNNKPKINEKKLLKKLERLDAKRKALESLMIKCESLMINAKL